MSNVVRQRTCIGCRQQKAPESLVRIICRADGSLELSVASQGRGAWLCVGSSSCFARAKTTRGFDRAFQRSIGARAIDALHKQLGLENS